MPVPNLGVARVLQLRSCLRLWI